MTSVKFEEYFLNARKYLFDHPYQRRGQAFYNYLYEFDPEAAACVHAASDPPCDPFYREERFDQFLAYLKETWSE